jgi:N-acetyl-anhydromuramyl-L-alanine amidase AmpD
VEWLNRWTLNLAFANRHDGKEPLSRAQIDRAQRILDAWRSRYEVQAVLTHAMIAPGRKSDPQRIPNFHIGDFG